MSFSSIAAMLSAAQVSGQPLYAVIRDADCQENGYDAAASYRQIAALWTAMQQSSRQYCASDRSNSGLIGGDAARFRAAAEAGRLLGGTYFQRVTEEALKVAECNACMKRIVAAPTAGSCGVLPAVLIPLVEVRDVAEETILQALYIAAGFGQVTALRASVAGAGRARGRYACTEAAQRRQNQQRADRQRAGAVDDRLLDLTEVEHPQPARAVSAPGQPVDDDAQPVKQQQRARHAERDRARHIAQAAPRIPEDGKRVRSGEQRRAQHERCGVDGGGALLFRALGCLREQRADLLAHDLPAEDE